MPFISWISEFPKPTSTLEKCTKSVYKARDTHQIWYQLLWWSLFTTGFFSQYAVQIAPLEMEPLLQLCCFWRYQKIINRVVEWNDLNFDSQGFFDIQSLQFSRNWHQLWFFKWNNVYLFWQIDRTFFFDFIDINKLHIWMENDWAFDDHSWWNLTSEMFKKCRRRADNNYFTG